MKYSWCVVSVVLFLSISGTALSEFSGKLEGRSSENFGVWDSLVQQTIQNKDAENLTAIFRIPTPEAGMSAELYRNDLFNIFSSDPGFFIHTALKEYSGNSDCILQWLVSENSQAVPFYQLRSELEEAAVQAKGNTEVEMKKFLGRAQEVYHSLRQGENSLDVSECPSQS